MVRAAIATFSGVLILFALPAFAQLNATGQSALMIAASPASPAPNSIVHLTAESPLLDLSESTLTWSVDGAPAGTGLSIDVPLGAAGSRTSVSLSVSGASGSDSASVTLAPAAIDLLWEADSYTPPFYAGRAIPSSGSNIRVLAVPHFTRAGGSTIPASALIFTWKANGAVLKAQSGVGADFATIPAAILYGSDTITVDAQTADGSQTGEASVAVRTQAPQLLLYINNPLFGIMYHQALAETGTTGDSEITFTAVPYFISATSPKSTALSYTWTIGGNTMTTDPNDPNELTASAKEPGSAQIGLSIANPSDPFVSADGSWDVSFGTSGSFTGRGAGAQNDAFHSGIQ